MSIRPIYKHAGLLLAAKVIGYVFPILILPLLTRRLGPEAYGELVYATSFIIFFYLLTEYGVQVTATRSIAMARHDINKTSAIFFQVIIFRLLLCLIGYIFLLAFAGIFNISEGRFTRLSLAYLLTIGEAINPAWFFIGQEKPMGFAFSTLASRAITLPLIFIFIRSGADINTAVFLNSLPFILSGVCSFFWGFITLKMSFVCPSFRGLIQELRTGFSAAISNAATNINQPMAILYLGHMSNVSTMGIFGAATTIIAAAKQILIPLSQLAYSHTSFIESRDQGKAIKAKTMSVLWVAIAGAIISIFLLIGAELITAVFYGKQYLAAANSIRIMSMIPFLFLLWQTVSTQFLFSTGRGYLVVLAMCISNIACFITCVIMIPSFHQTGAASALIAAELSSAALMILTALLVRNHELKRFPERF